MRTSPSLGATMMAQPLKAAMQARTRRVGARRMAKS
jgi:hypothetical protein